MSIKTELVKCFFFNKKIHKISDKKILYSEYTNNKDITNYQIDKFNKLWMDISVNIPFYKMWKKKYSLPDKINSISELKEFPVMTKNTINEYKELIFNELVDYRIMSTGGTSGVTTEFPMSNLDSIEAYTNAYLGRSWWDIKPLDDILMFWGHSHLFGKGLGGKLNYYKKEFANYLINTKKISSYKLDVTNVKSFYENIIENNPSCIISYSSNIFKICKYMEENNLVYKNKKLKAIILTSETVNNADVDLIKKLLCPNVVNEYGMAETGSIAYSNDYTNEIKVFWDSFIITTNESDELILTTIGSKLFPLINYSSEDKIKVNSEHNGSIIAIASIEGKIRNILNIRLKDGSIKEVSTILFDHIIKYYPNIYSIQYKQSDGNNIEIHITSNKKINLIDLKQYVDNKLKIEIENIDYDSIIFKQAKDIEKTIAGKNKIIL